MTTDRTMQFVDEVIAELKALLARLEQRRQEEAGHAGNSG